MNRDAAAPEDDIVVNTGVSGAVVDKGTMMKFMPYFAQSVRHGLQVRMSGKGGILYINKYIYIYNTLHSQLGMVSR